MGGFRRVLSFFLLFFKIRIWASRLEINKAPGSPLYDVSEGGSAKQQLNYTMRYIPLHDADSSILTAGVKS